MVTLHAETVNKIVCDITKKNNKLIDTNENSIFVDFITGPIQSGKTYMSNEAIKETIKNGLFDTDHVIRCDLAKEKTIPESLISNQYDDKPYLILLDNCESKLQLVEARNALDKINKALIICIVKTYCFSTVFPDDHISPFSFLSIKDFAGLEILFIPRLITPKEFLQIRKLPVNKQTLESNFDSYVKYSSFPEAAIKKDPIVADNLISLINKSIIETIYTREKCNKESLANILAFVLKNIGLPLQIKTIAKTLNYNYRTVKRYLDILRKYVLIYECKYRNIDADENKETETKKYYTYYSGFLHFYLKNNDHPAHQNVLENIILLLMNRYLFFSDSVFGGVVTRKLNYDFLINDPCTFSEEFFDYFSILAKQDISSGRSEFSKKINALKKIQKEGRKFLLVEDDTPAQIKDGVEIINIYDWMLNDAEEFYKELWNNS